MAEVTLDEWILNHLGLPFVWGETDCFSLVIKYIREVYGETFGNKAPKLTSRRSAINEFNKMGGLEKALEELGCVSTRASFMEPGNVVIEPCADRFQLPSYGIAATRSMYLTTEEYRKSVLVSINRATLNTRVWRLDG